MLPEVGPLPTFHIAPTSESDLKYFLSLSVSCAMSIIIILILIIIIIIIASAIALFPLSLYGRKSQQR